MATIAKPVRRLSEKMIVPRFQRATRQREGIRSLGLVTPDGIARSAVDAGQLVVLPWREPWLSVHPGIVWLRKRPFAEAEQSLLNYLRDADGEMHTVSEAFCARFGLSADCGG